MFSIYLLLARIRSGFSYEDCCFSHSAGNYIYITRSRSHIMASTQPGTPRLLQEQCFQYLIDHLEDIPVEALALLPAAIRRTLAVHLPVADILQLEQTRFASGLDMPGVWKEVCEIRHLFSRYPKLVEMFESEIEDKEFVMMVVTYEALHHEEEKPHNSQAEQIYYLLEESPDDFQPPIPGPPVFFSPACIETPFYVPHCAVPSRFLPMHQNGVLKLLNTKYHICLERLYVDCSSCVDCSDLVEKFPRLKQLSISCMNNGIFQSFYLRSSLSGCGQCVHTLTLDDCPDEEIEKIVSTVVTVFTNSPANFQSLRHFRVAVCLASERRHYGCGNHRRAVMAQIGRSPKLALIVLCEAIETHCLLHSFSLRQWWGLDGHDIFGRDILGSILSLFRQPQFQCLTLSETSLSLKNIQQLVHTFLNTPSSGPQMLKLERIQVIYGRDQTALSIHDSSFLLNKSLVLDYFVGPSYSFTFGAGEQSPLKKWLSTICKLQLHNLTITDDSSQ